jgi:ubiquitin-activating enzyme E1
MFVHNVLLCSLQSVAIHDSGAVTAADLSSQFYLSESNIGAPRAASCISQLKELNQYVDVTAISEPMTEDIIKVRRGQSCHPQ